MATNYQNLNEMRLNVYRFLDGDMSLEARRDFLEELSENESLSTIFEKEKRLKALIKDNVPRQRASTELIRTIKQKIRTN